ncbi:MFS transporter [Egibacter rhizosphaerae]|uniref:MFS transporter n=1 Tax=Egibacter rhizosphaerae TaxID=1670831 RepID=A0A411YF33_9ACTN|nr:MFS transporter [Egibacter rhizosphaerae]QBI19791.1 MFS transporter [Egibacter rhizosphaerae]
MSSRRTPPAEGEAPARTHALAGALAVTATVGYGVLLYAFGVVLEPMRAELGWSSAQASAGLTVGLVTAGLCAPTIGRAIDRFGARGVMVAGSLVGGTGVVAWASTTGFVTYVLAWVVIGLGMAMSLYEPAFAAITRHAPGRRRRSVLVVTVAAGFASTIFIPLTEALASALGWRDALLILGLALAAIATPLHLLGLPPRGRVVAPDPADPAGAGATAPDDAAAGPEPAAEPPAAPGPAAPAHPAPAPPPAAGAPAHQPPTLATSPTLRRLVLALVLGATPMVAVGAHLVAFLLEAGRSAALAAALAGGVGVAKVLGRLVVGPALGWLTARAAMAVSFGSQAVGLLLPLVVPTLTADVAMVVLFGLGSGAMTVVKPLYIVDLFGLRGFGVTQGRAVRVVQLAQAGAPLLIGAFATLAGGYWPGWLLLAVGSAVAAVLLPRPGHPPRPFTPRSPRRRSRAAS